MRSESRISRLNMLVSKKGTENGRKKMQKKKKKRKICTIRGRRWRGAVRLRWFLLNRQPLHILARRSLEHRYRGTSLTKNATPLGPYRRSMPRVLGWSEGGARFTWNMEFGEHHPRQTLARRCPRLLNRSPESSTVARPRVQKPRAPKFAAPPADFIRKHL